MEAHNVMHTCLSRLIFTLLLTLATCTYISHGLQRSTKNHGIDDEQLDEQSSAGKPTVLCLTGQTGPDVLLWQYFTTDVFCDTD